MSVFDSKNHRTPTAPAVPDPNAVEDIELALKDALIRIRDLEHRLIDICGTSGTNGKLGRLREAVEGHSGLIKSIAAAALTGILTGAVALYSAGQRNGARENEFQHLRSEVATLRQELHEARRAAPRPMPARNAPIGDDP